MHIEPNLSDVDQLLIAQVLAGDEDGWRTLVAKFQQRLTAFANGQLGSAGGSASADDVVQETFVSFLKSSQQFRGDCSLETYLFRILRYRINDFYRKQGSAKSTSVCRLNSEAQQVPAEDLSSSQHARRREQIELDQQRLSSAIFELTTTLKERENFRDLQVAESLFFAGLRNRQIAELMSITENEVAVTKHRLIKRLNQAVGETTAETPDEEFVPPNLQAIWRDLRPGCPKRTTLGKYTLEILPEPWDSFVRFHVEALGCEFCGANLSELNQEVENHSAKDEQLFQSTIGFLPGRPGS